MVESSRPATNADIARHYDQLDRFYREVWGEHVHHGLWRTGRETSEEAARELVNAVTAHLQFTPGAQVCDIGCGYGATSRILAQEFQAEVTGFTLSPAQHRYAESRNAPDAANPRYFLRDWLQNGLPDAAFDAAFAIESTEHMPDKAKVFAEAARVLRPGGRLVVCAWLAGDHPKPWHHRHLLEPICREGRMPGLGTEAEYVQWMETAGFTVTARADVSRQVRRTWPVCAGRFFRALFFRPSYLRFLLDRKNDNRIFALTMLRLWLAYGTGAMRYVIFSARRTGSETLSLVGEPDP